MVRVDGVMERVDGVLGEARRITEGANEVVGSARSITSGAEEVVGSARSITAGAEEVVGSKGKWAAIIAINFVGPLAYFARGRRVTAPVPLS